MKKRTMIFLCLFTCMCAQAQVTYRDIEYAHVNGFSLLLDVILPDTSDQTYPVILWVHGGAWLAGSKENPHGGFLVDFGFAVVSINYRLSQDAIFPAQIHDCKAAVRWIRANAPHYHLDTLHIGAFGSSAGGHLVALLGTSIDVTELEGHVGNFLSKSSDVQAVCDWYGPANLVSMCNTSPDHCSKNSPEGLLIGGDINQNKDKALAASPVTYVDGNEPPFLIMHGTDDPTVPFSQSVELDSLLNAAGQEVIFKPIVGAGHGGREFRSDTIRNMIVNFFDRHLKDENSAIEKVNVVPGSFELSQNIPNPFNFETKIGFTIREKSQVILKIFNINGKEVKTLVNEYRPTGEYEVGFNGSNLASGLYFYQLKTSSCSQIRKMILMK